MVKISYMIGNGLDIHFGLHSKYTDFYAWLEQNPKKYKDNNLISDILTNIYAKEIDKTKEENWDELTDWSDFEKELKKNLEFISKNENAIEIASRRVQELEEVSLLLREYLQNEEKKLKPLIEFNSELSTSSLSAPFLKLPPNHIALIRERLYNSFKNNPANKSSSSINFINFNYTSLLQEYIHTMKTVYVSNISDILNSQSFEINNTIYYPNGDFDDSPELGIGTEMDIPEGLFLSQDEIDYVSKESFARRRMDYRLDKIINSIKTSDIIVTYGLSLGESDALYIYHIVSTLIANKDTTAIVIMFDENYRKSNQGLRYFRKLDEIRTKIEKNYQHINSSENNDDIDVKTILNSRLLVLFDNGVKSENDPATMTYFPFKEVKNVNSNNSK
ncbi:AbiH family protein [Leuconostoc suionicum]|uniref:AbiH family protein n=1 Tax=Leuconostoc suionicum TaxID=1511761 RepID=UPI0032DFDEDA